MHRLFDSLQFRLAALVLLLVLGSVWGAVLLLNDMQEMRLRDLLASQQHSAASYVARDIENKLKLRLDALAMVAQRFPLDALDRHDKLENFLAERRAVYALFDSGLVVVKADGSRALADYPPHQRRHDLPYARIPPYREVIASRKPAIGPPVVGETNQLPSIVFAVPIYAKDGGLAAILAGETNIAHPNFIDLVDFKLGNSGDFLVVAPRDGIFITGTNPSFIMKPLPPPGTNSMHDRTMAGFEGAGITVNSSGVEELVSTRRVPSAGWLVVARLPTAEAFAPIRAQRHRVVIGALALSLLIALLVALALRRSLKPLASSAATLAAMTRGKQALAALPVTRNDEIGMLIASFNELQATLVAKEEKLRLAANVFSHAQEGIVITAPDGRIVDINPGFTALTGYSAEEAIGNTPNLLKSGRQDKAFYQSMWRALREQGHWQGEICNRRKDGAIYVERLAITGVYDEQGVLCHYIGIFADITTLKDHQSRLEHMAHYDALTQLPNRLLLSDRLQLALMQASRKTGLLALAFLDLDGFKPVNDRLGHEAGDLLLIEVAQRLKRCVRAGDTVARLGGDEFVLLLGDLESIEEIHRALERVLASLAEPYALAGGTASISASIGVALYPKNGTEPDVLLRQADQAMYAAKQDGRNRFHFFASAREPFGTDAHA